MKNDDEFADAKNTLPAYTRPLSQSYIQAIRMAILRGLKIFSPF